MKNRFVSKNLKSHAGKLRLFIKLLFAKMKLYYPPDIRVEDLPTLKKNISYILQSAFI